MINACNVLEIQINLVYLVLINTSLEEMFAVYITNHFYTNNNVWKSALMDFILTKLQNFALNALNNAKHVFKRLYARNAHMVMDFKEEYVLISVTKDFS